MKAANPISFADKRNREKKIAKGFALWNPFTGVIVPPRYFGSFNLAPALPVP